MTSPQCATNRLCARSFLFATTYERFVLIYQDALQRLGIGVTVRVVDPVQYENRLRNWEFDIIVAAWEESQTPGNEQRDYWGSRAAKAPGSRNLIGVADTAIDALIDHVVLATDWIELVAATRALDCVLLWHHHVVPQWSYNKVRTARWDRFAKPQLMPILRLSAFPDIWWWDAERAARIATQR